MTDELKDGQEAGLTPMKDPLLCQRCNAQLKDASLHACPFQADVHDDPTPCCNCCDDCAYECAQDI